MSDGPAWYVVAVMPRREFAAERDIMALGFETYIPRQQRRKIYRGKLLTVAEPLLTGYLFVAFDREREHWGAIEDCDDVLGIIKSKTAATPICVRAGELELLRRAEVAGLFNFSRPGASYAEGDNVEIHGDHPLAGFRAKVKAAKGKKKIRIILKYLGIAEIDPMYLRKV